MREELLGDGRGVLVPFGDSGAMATAITGLLKNDTRRHALRKRAYLIGREMIWSKTAQHYMTSFESARRNPTSQSIRRLGLKTLEEERLELPHVRLDHLTRLSDSTGIFQHAIYSFPDFTLCHVRYLQLFCYGTLGRFIASHGAGPLMSPLFLKYEKARV